jgi:hypothetical protein
LKRLLDDRTLSIQKIPSGFVAVDEMGHTLPLSFPMLATLGALSERVAVEAVITSAESLVNLRQKLVEYFSIEELRTLCFDLGVEFDNLGGEGKVGKARELVAHLQRRGRIPELVDVASKLRPNVSWVITFSRDADGKVYITDAFAAPKV